MSNVNLVLSLPNSAITATRLGVSGFVWHRSPGTSGKYHGRSVLADLALKDGYPAFAFLNEGGWRDADADTRLALDAARAGKVFRQLLFTELEWRFPAEISHAFDRAS